MRIWDIHPGYLNRQSLLGEHRELHGLLNVLTLGKLGYSRHPETLRWVGKEGALRCRHAQLVAEMHLRGYQDKSPVASTDEEVVWPTIWINSPAEQVTLLQEKYVGKEPGRIPFPKSTTQLWAQHTYSVMARSMKRYQEIGHILATAPHTITFDQLLLELVTLMRIPPSQELWRTTVVDLWQYVHESYEGPVSETNGWSPSHRMAVIQQLAMAKGIVPLQESTVLSDSFSDGGDGLA